MGFLVIHKSLAQKSPQDWDPQPHAKAIFCEALVLAQNSRGDNFSIPASNFLCIYICICICISHVNNVLSTLYIPFKVKFYVSSDVFLM